mmetsp:Transcript_8334/g.24843  ORF Transcript_8334/g.24843 Transcript_8334/m.24843 type:complete len:321 (-) Transcript_8334:12-974(-)
MALLVLHTACRRGHVAIVRMALEDGVDVNGTREGVTPLLVACDRGHSDVATLLLDRGADPNRASSEGLTPLMAACTLDLIDAATTLLERGAEVDLQSPGGVTALIIASIRGQVAAVQLLLDNGATVDLSQTRGATPFFLACRYGHVDAARLLVDRGAEVDRASVDSATPLIIASFHGQVDTARLCLERKEEKNGLRKMEARLKTPPATAATRRWRPGWRAYAQSDGSVTSRSRDTSWCFCGPSPRRAWRGGSARFTARSACWTFSFLASRRRKDTSKQREARACRTTSFRSSPATTGAGNRDDSTAESTLARPRPRNITT